MGGFHSQDVTDDPDAPHISGQTYRLVINHLRSHKLWRPVHHLKRCGVICKYTMCIKCQISDNGNDKQSSCDDFTSNNQES